MSLEGGTDWISTAIKDSSLIKGDGWLVHQAAISVLMLGCFCPRVLQGAREAHRLLFRGNTSSQHVQGRATRPYGGSPSLIKCEQDQQIAEGISGGGFGLPWGAVTGSNLPPYRIPSRCKHSDIILMNILVNCRDLTVSVHYSHVKAHQDDTISFDKLTRKSQLNCICDHLAKQRIGESAQLKHRPSSLFPLEPIGIFIAGAKLSSYPGQQMQSHAHRQLATRLCIPTEFRRIPAEFRQKAPAGTECDRNRPEQAPECAII